MAGQGKRAALPAKGRDRTAHGIMKEGSGEMKAKAIILLTVLGILMVSVSCLAETASGDCGTRVTWTYSDGTLTISGEGEMANYTAVNGAPWEKSKVKTVVVEPGVTSVGAHAFNGCSGLTSVILPERLMSVKASAFYDCSSLESITLPDSVTEVGNSAFGECTALSQITLSRSLKSIGSSAFYDCSELSSLFIPDSVTSIHGYAFTNSGLRTIHLSDTLDNLGTNVFENCLQLEEIVWPSSMNFVPKNAFLYSSIRSITLPEGVTKIEEGAFNSTHLLSEIYLPISLNNIGNRAFCDCPNLKDVYYAGTEDEKAVLMKNTKMDNDGLTNENVYWHYGASGECAIGIHHLVNGVCRSCHRSFDISGMTVVQLPEDLTVLEAEALRGTGAQAVIVPAGCTEIGSRAFADCPDLQYVLLPEGVTLATDALSGTEAELLYR